MVDSLSFVAEGSFSRNNCRVFNHVVLEVGVLFVLFMSNVSRLLMLLLLFLMDWFGWVSRASSKGVLGGISMSAVAAETTRSCGIYNTRNSGGCLLEGVGQSRKGRIVDDISARTTWESCRRSIPRRESCSVKVTTVSV